MKEVYICSECRTRHLSMADFYFHCQAWHKDEPYVPYEIDMRELSPQEIEDDLS